MYIPEQTKAYFENQGIFIKHYPDATHSDFIERKWKEEYEEYISYYKDNVRGYNIDKDGREFTNVLYETIEELQRRAVQAADINVYQSGRSLDSYDCTDLFIEYPHDGTTRIICQKIATKSKEISIEYVQKLIAKDIKAYSGTFGNFADAINKIIDRLGYKHRFSVYPTTYGIGVWLFYNWRADEEIKKIEDILNSNKVEYYNEYSDKHYVYRFKISKKQANIKLAANCSDAPDSKK